MSDEREDDRTALRAAFSELHRGESASAPAFDELMARPRPAAAAGTEPSPRRVRQRSAHALRESPAHPRTRPLLVARWAAAAILVVAAAGGVWLRRSRSEPPLAPVDVEALAEWVAPTDFLLVTPAADLLHTTPQIPGPLPLDLTDTGSRPAPGDTR